MESFRTQSAHDRLAALRQPATKNHAEPVSYSRRMMMASAAGLIAVVFFGAVYFIQRQAPVGEGVPMAVVAPQVVTPEVLLDGESYLAIAAQVGTFPPSLSAGDTVRVVVVPRFDDNDVTRTLDDNVVIRHIEPPTEFGNTAVITVRAPLTVATAIASAEKIHLAVIEEAAPR
jgi:hypothetical protein